MSEKTINRNFIPAIVWSNALLPILAEGHLLRLPIEGLSMYPLLVGRRDEVLLADVKGKKLRRGDIVLYVRQDGTHVLHRIHHVDLNNYYMFGDAQTWIEGPINEDNVLGVVISVIRKGKAIECNSFGYRFISQIWMVMRPARPLILKIIDRIPIIVKILNIILRPIHSK
ncbi:S24/S26 family peptidase [Dehalobacter sp. CF]|jgi:hypothetical protein|uniref:S24/S26 family peptidase n=1 Tax=Dehalobacter sp. CF TaxID=1131462 RepID=UPI00068E363E|nr:S24/S26 family peptidase [Dehalobacter sp. CF]